MKKLLPFVALCVFFGVSVSKADQPVASGIVSIENPPVNIPTLHPNMLVRDPSIYAHYNSAIVFKDTCTLTNYPTNYAMNNGDAVGGWTDLAGSWTLTTSAVTSMGTYYLGSSTNGVQGLPSVVFQQSGGLSSATGFWDGLYATGYSIIALFKPQGNTTAYRVLASNAASGSYYFALRPRVSSYNNTYSNINGSTLSTPISNVNTGNIDDAALLNNTTTYTNGVVAYWTVSSTNFVRQGINGTEITTGQASAGTPAGALLVGDGAALGFPFQSPLVDLNFYKGVLTQAQLTKETSRLMSLGTPQTPLVICDWNSFGGGYLPSALRNELNCPTMMKNFLGNPNTIQLSVSGQTTLQKVTASLPTVQLLANQNSYRKTAYLLWEGTNDMHSGSGNKTAAQAWTNYQVMITSAAQYGVKDIFVGTVIVRNDASLAQFEARRKEFNALVRANARAIGRAYGVNVIVVDIPKLIPAYDSLPTASTPNLFYLSSDGIHPSRNGYALIANEWAKAIQKQWYKETTTNF